MNLERVGFNLRNFDMVFIWKDLNRDVGRIDSIPSTSLDTIKVGAAQWGWGPAHMLLCMGGHRQNGALQGLYPLCLHQSRQHIAGWMGSIACKHATSGVQVLPPHLN